MVSVEGFKRKTGKLHGHRTHVGHQESVTSFGRGFWENGVFKKLHEVDVTRDKGRETSCYGISHCVFGRTLMLGLIKITSWKRRGGRCENDAKATAGNVITRVHRSKIKKRRTVLHRFELRPLNIYFLIRIYPTCKPLHHRARRWQALLLLPHDCVPSRADKP
jgi:hypothetical protein